MNIAFFTEGSYLGKHDRNNTNARTDVAWMIALDATHHSLGSTLNGMSYDLGIIILPKKNIDKLMQQDIMGYLKISCKKVAIMQEGPNWYWQDYTMEEQIWYFNTLQEADFLLCHNQSDVNYYKGLTGKNTYVMPSLMIEDSLIGLPQIDELPNRKGVMIGGNMTSWYGGFDSMIVANEISTKISAPSMGRKIPREDELHIQHLPYMNWTQWIHSLNNVKYGVHLMRTHAAGTFALNCSYLGIPCIGYKGLDTQQYLHPNTTVEIGDINGAIEIANKLKNDSEFYELCSQQTKEFYFGYTEEKYKEKMNSIFIKEGVIK